MRLPLTPLRFLERAQRLYGEKTGVICGAERLTFARLFERCRRLAGALIGMGLKPGERVALLSYNCHRLLEAYYGILQAKGVLLPLNIRLAPPEIAFILKDSDARVLFLDPDFLPLVEEIKSQLPEETRFSSWSRPSRHPPGLDLWPTTSYWPKPALLLLIFWKWMKIRLPSFFIPAAPAVIRRV